MKEGIKERTVGRKTERIIERITVSMGKKAQAWTARQERRRERIKW